MMMLHMAATRTQIYLTKEQRRLLDRATGATGLPMTEIVRRALDAYLHDDIDAGPVLQSTFGVAPDASVPPRDEWDRG